MKLKSLVTVGLFSAFLPLASARPWTSADGSKTFEGKLQEYDQDAQKVTVLINGRPTTFGIDKLSDQDREFLKTWTPPLTQEAIDSTLASQKVGQHLTEKTLSRLTGKRFKKSKLDKAPEYYLLYFSASW